MYEELDAVSTKIISESKQSPPPPNEVRSNASFPMKLTESSYKIGPWEIVPWVEQHLQ